MDRFFTGNEYFILIRCGFFAIMTNALEFQCRLMHELKIQSKAFTRWEANTFLRNALPDRSKSVVGLSSKYLKNTLTFHRNCFQ